MLLRQSTRRKRWLKDLESFGGMPNSIGFAVCFSRLLLPRRANLSLHFAQLSESQSQQKSVSLEKRAKKNLRGIPSPKKRAGREDVESDCHFGDFLQRFERVPISKRREQSRNAVK
jgi:hypothetical protein